MISVTLQFNDFAAAAHALMRIATPEKFAQAVSAVAVRTGDGPATTVLLAPREIAHAGRPDVGAPEAPALPPTPPADPAAAAFGGAVAQAAPLISGTTNLNPMVAAVNAPPHVPVALPTPPAAPIAPTAATAPTAVPGTVGRDSTGLPWDARIHASTKTKVASGAWTAKRNVDPVFKAQVEADLRGVPAPAPAAGAPATPPAAPPVAPPTPPAAPGAGPTTFAEMAAKLGEHFAGPNAALAQAACQNALAGQGLQHLGQLAGVPERIPAVWAEFTRLLG